MAHPASVGPSTEPKVIGIMGPGRLGSALWASLEHLGYVVDVLGRCEDESNPDALPALLARCDMLCLTLPDDLLEGVIGRLYKLSLAGRRILIHSGLFPLGQLDHLVQKGAVVAKLHALYSFSQKAKKLFPANVPFAIQGDPHSLAILEGWIESWQGQAHHLNDGDLTRYHLAAVYASNFLPLLIRTGAHILEPLADSPQAALDWLAPLVRNSVAAAFDGTNSKPFSGPAIRGDRGTIAVHTDFMREHSPEWEALYHAASKALLEIQEGKRAIPLDQDASSG